MSDEYHDAVFLIRNACSGTYLELSLTTEPVDIIDELIGPYSAGYRLPSESEGAVCFSPEGQCDFDKR
jgi:hypothetical protein